jgi:hypothetical protein
VEIAVPTTRDAGHTVESGGKSREHTTDAGETRLHSSNVKGGAGAVVVGLSDVLRWRNVNAKFWDMDYVNLMLGGLGTLIGMEEGHHVMSSTAEAPYAPKLQVVLDKRRLQQ